MTEENLDGNATVETPQGNIAVNAILSALGILGAVLVLNNGEVSERKAANFDQKTIEITSEALPVQYDTIPARAEINFVIDSIPTVYDENGDMVSRDTVAHWDTTNIPQVIREIRRLNPSLPNGKNNYKLELKPGQRYVQQSRIDGILVGQISVYMPDTLSENCVHGLIVSMPSLTVIDTTKTRW